MEVEGEVVRRKRLGACLCLPTATPATRMSKLFKAKEASPAEGSAAVLPAVPVPGQAYRYTQEIAQMVRLAVLLFGSACSSSFPTSSGWLTAASMHLADRCLSLARSRIRSARQSATSKTSSGAKSLNS